MKLLAFTVLLTVAVSSAQDVELTLDPPGEPGGQFLKGASLTIKCKVKPAVLDLLRVVKIDAEDKQVEISTNDFLNDPFKASGRYTIDQTVGEFKEVTISITDMQGADSGTYECQHVLLDGTTNDAREDIKVSVPVKSVELLQYKDGLPTELSDGDSLILVEGEDHGVICRITIEDSQEVPTVEIKLEDKVITDMFSMEDEPIVSGPDGLKQYDNTMLYEHLTAQPEITSNGKTMTCSASVPGYDTVTKSVTMEVHYGPRLTCESVMVQIGDPATVVCEGQLHPDVELVAVTWDRNPERYVLNLDKLDHERHHLTSESKGDDMFHFTVKIDEVVEEDFGAYNFEVQNAVASAIKEVQLIEAVPPTEKVTPEPEPETKPPTPAAETPEATPAYNPVKDEGGDNGAVTVTSQITMTCLALMAVLLVHWS